MFEYTVTMNLTNGDSTMTFLMARNEDDAYAGARENEGVDHTAVEDWTAVLGW